MTPLHSERILRHRFRHAVALVRGADNMAQVYFPAGTFKEAQHAAKSAADLSGEPPNSNLRMVRVNDLLDSYYNRRGACPEFTLRMNTAAGQVLERMIEEGAVQEFTLHLSEQDTPQQWIAKAAALIKAAKGAVVQHSYKVERYQDDAVLQVKIPHKPYSYIVFKGEAEHAAHQAVSELPAGYEGQTVDSLMTADGTSYWGFYVPNQSPEHALIERLAHLRHLTLPHVDATSIVDELQVMQADAKPERDLLNRLRPHISLIGTMEGGDKAYVVFDPSFAREARRLIDAYAQDPSLLPGFLHLGAPTHLPYYYRYPLVTLSSNSPALKTLLGETSSIRHIHVKDGDPAHCEREIGKALQQRSLAVWGVDAVKSDSRSLR